MFQLGMWSSSGGNFYQLMNYEGHFRNSVYYFIAITNYKITTLLIFLNVYTKVLHSK